MMKLSNKHILILAGSFVLSAILLYFLFRKPKVVRTASKYVGQREKTGGSYEYGFSDASFESKMRANGFAEGYDWCAIFVRSVVLDSVPESKKIILKTLMNPSSQLTYNNLLKASKQYPWIQISETPKSGAIVTWQSQSDKNRGHIGIVKSFSGADFRTIEGNASDGTGKDGVVQKKHNLSEKNKTSGLKLHNYFIKIK